ncbi:MAG: carbon-nitrogen family hydrolase [Promethearchaeota archaeon]
MRIQIALVQMEIEDGEKEKNLEAILKILQQILKEKNIPDIVCFPELFTTGYDLINAEKYAEALPGETIKKIKEFSQNKFIVIGTILEKKNGKIFNTAFILGKSGKIIGKYRKTHLFTPMLEKEFLQAGDKIKTFNLPELKNLNIGLAICYDLRFPELFRMLALEGAQIIFIPSEFPSPKKKIWKTLLRARAIENQIFIVGVNRVGKGKSNDFFGCSLISNGEYEEILNNKPEIKIFSADLNSLNQIRLKLPLMKDRRIDLFKL